MQQAQIALIYAQPVYATHKINKKKKLYIHTHKRITDIIVFAAQSTQLNRLTLAFGGIDM